MTALTAIITGANRGTGYALWKRFRDAGVETLALNRTLRDLEGEIECDLTDERSVEVACNAVLARIQRLDFCIFNAAERRIGLLSETTTDAMKTSFTVSVVSTFQIVRRVLPVMTPGSGVFVFVNSQAAEQFFEGGAAYCVAKAGQRALAEVVRMECRQSGIGVTTVTPGAIRNRESDTSSTKIDPAELAEAVWRLAGLGQSSIVSEVEVRPRNPAKAADEGIARLFTW
jgi:3-oxoacyl-[acyl-carrier protein] reductase